MLQMLLGPAMELGKEFLQGKAEEKKAIQQRKISQINNDADWESKMAAASKDSWKDEFFSIILAMPLIAVAYGVAMDSPAVIERLDAAFDTLNTLPEWYQYLLFVAVTSSFGIRGADKIMNMRKNK